jgi:Spy/CpxP family protein refolding chaperone
MKALTALAVEILLFMNTALLAQQTSKTATPLTDDDIALLRADIQADKTDVITKTMQFTEAQSKAFWPLYREYANEQQKIGDQRVSLIKDYAAHFDSIDDAAANDFMMRFLKYDKDNHDLRAKYYPKFKEAVGARQAAKFFQVDNRLNLLVNLQLARLVPIIH